MTTIHTIIISIVEGVTEFLPISSTGHIILVSEVLGISSTTFTKSFEIIIQFGAILSVLVLYSKRLFKDIDLLKKTIVAFLPTAFIGLIFYKIIKTYLLDNVWVVVASLFIGGVIIIWFEKKLASSPLPPDCPLTYKKAFIIGLAQSVAMIPGVSRSAATIVGGQLIDLSRRQIVEFSFILAIPTMAAAGALDLYKNYQLFTSADFTQLALGLVISFIVATLAIKTFLKYIQTNNLVLFGWYRIALAIISAIIFIKI